MDNKSLAAILDALIGKNFPLAFYFLPGVTEPELIIQTQNPLHQLDSYQNLNGKAGFVFAPFAITTASPLVLIHPDIHLSGKNEMTGFTWEPIFANTSFGDSPDYGFCIEMTRMDYESTLASLIVRIQNAEFEKVVLSRTISVSFSQAQTPGNLILALKEKNDNAFVSLVHLPGIGTWMGATPELLLGKEKGQFLTTSVAGTMPIGQDCGEIPWTAKEYREQEIVTHFIENALQDFGIPDYNKTGPFTAFAGAVAHLKSEILFPAEKIEDRLGSLVAALHPTPAVCGIDREKAKAFILAHECHSREYYTGFLGPWNLDGAFRLHVNIRCMKLSASQGCLYVGGGITSESIIEKEWEETYHKAKTLLAILQ